MAPLGTELDLGHPCAFAHGCTEAAAVVEQQLVEIGAPDVITMIDAQIRIAVTRCLPAGAPSR
jgi:hypothetical protein